jgi:flagellar M-ring protein FliF
MPPRASVLVETSFGKDISQDVADSIIRLVSASMAGLQKDNVQLTDQKGRHYYARDAENASFLAVQRQEHERRVEEEMRQKVEALVRSYYPGTEAYGFVNVVLDMDQREKQTRTVLEGMPLRTRSHKIEQETTEAPPAEVGTIPNVAGAPNTAGGATSHSTYAEKMSETTNENSYEEMQEVFAPGAVEDLSVSVVMHLPSRPVREPETGEFVLDEQTGEPQRQAAPELGEDELVGLQMAIAEAVNHQQWREIQVKQVPWEPAYEPRLERDWALVLARFAAENIGLLLLTGVAVACLVMIWTQVRRVIPAEEMLGLEEEVEPETSPFEQVSDQDRANEEFEQMRNRVSDLVNEDPKKAASLVRRWLVME